MFQLIQFYCFSSFSGAALFYTEAQKFSPSSCSNLLWLCVLLCSLFYVLRLRSFVIICHSSSWGFYIHLSFGVICFVSIANEKIMHEYAAKNRRYRRKCNQLSVAFFSSHLRNIRFAYGFFGVWGFIMNNMTQ